jgi:site-specific DNA recombinase
MSRPEVKRKVRCAVYTRKSSEEGLELSFNSLDAQREACAAYVDSQRHEGWLALDDRYDDGGYSGGTLERPALQRLIRDVEAGRVDTVVCYKIDRLSRSLTDFAKLVDVFERNSVTFVSVTQSFCTTTSMGRLTLNILLSFAQFERELAGERIRDKFAASRAKGMWMGGSPPLGYDVRDRKLVVNPAEAELVRLIFRRFLDLGSALLLIRELNAQGYRTKSWTTQAGTFREGRPFDKGTLYKVLRNRTYLGEAVHKGKSYPGEHEPIIDRVTWDRVHEVLTSNAKRRGNEARARTPAPLRGLMRCTHCSSAMTPTHTRRALSVLHLPRRQPQRPRYLPGALDRRQRGGGAGARAGASAARVARVGRTDDHRGAPGERRSRGHRTCRRRRHRRPRGARTGVGRALSSRAGAHPAAADRADRRRARRHLRDAACCGDSQPRRRVGERRGCGP